jgi:hypothetical protein
MTFLQGVTAMESPYSPSSADGRIVIIANGFLPFPIPLGQVADIYRANGFAAHVVPFDWRNKMCLRYYAQTISSLTERLRTPNKPRVDIVGLSMGGLAAIFAVKLLNSAPRIRTVLTIGSPFYGSPLATLGTMTPWFHRPARQMSPGSPLLRELRRAKLPEHVRFISIGGSYDMISPFPTTQVEDAKNYTWCFGHHELVYPWLHAEAVKLLL